ncbi:MAG: GH92 family glycosyl hydrolase [Candidatus Pedobacter colombiensis]|uniref:GH92 family glycosyl hydrolase n=1 Tax=Candidatus Pedobacter colombiensis TaxID=3121371 RepID=A0AAJ5W8E4_9SPHI|nr:GH92 family glycosyl hydrolase [Pedobacter sp.]WEK19971.1 MAG: GH92 family glycosyl hydrolase [Pedobacter sp.]
MQYKSIYRSTCLLLSTFTIVIWGAAALKAQSPGVLPYVQPMVGTSNSTTIAALKHGEGTEQLANTIPAVGVPFGMTQWTPQTQRTEQKCLAPYYYKDSKLSGFRGTHWLSGSCTQDYGSFTIMPITGGLKTKADDYMTPYSHEQEVSTANYYRIKLDHYQVTAEFTALARSSMMQFTMNKADSLYILVTPNSDKRKGYVKVDQQRQEIVGYNPAHRIYQGLGKPAGFSGYFVIRVEKAFTAKGTFSEEKVYLTDSIMNQKDLGAFIGFNLKSGEQIKLRIGTSFTSIAQARKNLDAEIPAWNFEVVKKQAEGIWEKALQKISVQGKDAKQKRIFYTALYHSMQHPRLFNDVDGTYPKFAHQYENAKLEQGNYYDDFSMWDIYRAQLPLLEIIQPKLVNSMVNSIVLKGQQGKWLPIFPCWNSYTGAMIGDHATAFIASAYLKGIKNYDVNAAYSLMRQNAFDSPSQTDYVDGKGRRALPSYLKYGYVPLEDPVLEAFHKGEQVSRTLEYAFDDYALACVAKDLNKTADYNALIKRAQNYKNVFDPALGFMNGKSEKGTWYTPFDADKKLSFITEGTSRQYSLYVPQDVPGLAKLMGGTKQLETALDNLFSKGEYWHGNEPGHQIPFMYNYTSSPWKTQREVRRILFEEYTEGPGGLSGNDDTGQMSAWYVFGAVGLYPVDPVSGQYILSAPLFDNIRINLGGNKALEIATYNNSPENKYISKVKLNGQSYTKGYIAHKELMKGGKLEIYLQNIPNKDWASKAVDRPSGISAY